MLRGETEVDLKINEIIWLQQFAEKIERKHNVSREEVEEIIRNQPRYKLIEKGRIVGENLYRAFGQTDDGRYLLLFLIYKSHGRALIISARDASTKEQRRYGQKKK